MVRRAFLLLAVIFFLGSCAFFGSSMFPVAVSEDMSWIINNGESPKIFIHKNNQGDELLFLANINHENNNSCIAVFDPSLNLRGYLEDGRDGILTDGLGFIDHNDDFIIGQMKINRFGSAEDSLWIPVPGLYRNSFIYRWTDTDTGTDYYIRIEYDGNIGILTSDWLNTSYLSMMIPNWGESMIINQSDPDLNTFVVATRVPEDGIEIRDYNKKDLFDYVTGVIPILERLSVVVIDNSELTQWVTRCSRGYFVSSYSGEYILYDFDGKKIDSIQNKNYSGQIITIDFNSEYYYMIDDSEGKIIKERLPF